MSSIFFIRFGCDEVPPSDYDYCLVALINF